MFDRGHSMRKALLLVVMLALALVGAGPAAAQTSAVQNGRQGGTLAWGCAAVSTVAVAAAVVINSQTLVNVASGAMVAPISPALLYGGLGAIVASSFCALGYHVVPVFVSFGGGAPAPAVPAAAGDRYAEAAR